MEYKICHGFNILKPENLLTEYHDQTVTEYPQIMYHKLYETFMRKKTFTIFTVTLALGVYHVSLNFLFDLVHFFYSQNLEHFLLWSRHKTSIRPELAYKISSSYV